MLRRILKAVVSAIEVPARAPDPAPVAPPPRPQRAKRKLTLEQALAAHHKPGMTYAQITAIINELGYRTKTGKEWQQANLRLVMEPLGLIGSRRHPDGVTRNRQKNRPKLASRLELQRLANSREIVARRVTRRRSIHPDQMTLIGA